MNKRIRSIGFVLSLILICSLLITGCRGKNINEETKKNVIYDKTTEIPVYSEEETDEIFEYILSLPKESVTYQEFRDKHVTPDATLIGKDGRQELYDEAVSLSEATGDDMVARTFMFLNDSNLPIYVYVSHTKDGFFMYEYDGYTQTAESKDDSSSEDNANAYVGKYKQVLPVESEYTDGTRYTTFYLVSDENLTSDELKKKIEDGEDMAYSDVFWLYDVDIVKE